MLSQINALRTYGTGDRHGERAKQGMFDICDGRAARWGGFFVDVGDSLRTIATS